MKKVIDIEIVSKEFSHAFHDERKLRQAYEDARAAKRNVLQRLVEKREDLVLNDTVVFAKGELGLLSGVSWDAAEYRPEGLPHGAPARAFLPVIVPNRIEYYQLKKDGTFGKRIRSAWVGRTWYQPARPVVIVGRLSEGFDPKTFDPSTIES